MIDRLRLSGGRQGTFVSIIMIDRLRLLGGYQSIFIIVIDTKVSYSSTLTGSMLILLNIPLPNMNDNLELFIKQYITVGLKLFGLWLVMRDVFRYCI